MTSTTDGDDYSLLEELSSSNYEIVNKQPDIQGWDVTDAGGNKIGEVDELLFNPPSRKVRYIVLHMENNDMGLEDGRVLLPIGIAELHENDDTVVIPQITKKQILALPIYEKGREINADTEAQIRNVLLSPSGNVVAGANFYDHDHFKETGVYKEPV